MDIEQDSASKDRQMLDPELFRRCYEGTVEEVLAYFPRRESFRSLDGFTALELAIDADRTDLVNTLLDAGVDIEIHGTSVLLRATAHANINILYVLLNHGIPVDSKDDKVRITALMVAAMNGNKLKLLSLLKRGAEIDAQSHNGRTPLLYAVEKRRAECVEILLHRGANIDIRDTRGNTVLIRTSRKGYTEIVKKLLEHDADTGGTNIDGNTALSQALYKGYDEIVALLKAHSQEPAV